MPDALDAEIRARRGLLDADTALRAMHEPDDYAQWYAARKRLAWDEALGVQLALAQRRWLAGANPAVPRPAEARRPARRLRRPAARSPSPPASARSAPRSPTSSPAPHPMHRLLQGEVGSGKTVVALRAMLQAVDAGGQAALLAPTEVLAAQHARTIDALLGPLARGGQLGGAEAAHPRRAAHRLAAARPRARRRCSTPRAARPASSSARTR